MNDIPKQFTVLVKRVLVEVALIDVEERSDVLARHTAYQQAENDKGLEWEPVQQQITVEGAYQS